MDLKFGAYYNPGVQGDTIQMSNLPGRRWNYKVMNSLSKKCLPAMIIGIQ